MDEKVMKGEVRALLDDECQVRYGFCEWTWVDVKDLSYHHPEMMPSGGCKDVEKQFNLGHQQQDISVETSTQQEAQCSPILENPKVKLEEHIGLVLPKSPEELSEVARMQ